MQREVAEWKHRVTTLIVRSALSNFYDRLVVPFVRGIERLMGPPPFGQSVVAVGRVREEAEDG